MILRSTDGGEGGTEAPKETDKTVESGFKKLVEKHQNDGIALARELYGQTYQLREKLRIAEGRVPEGAVVLDGKQAAEWNDYRALGKPEKVKLSIDSLNEANTRIKKYERDEVIASVVEATGAKPTALKRLVRDEEFEVQDHEDPKTKTKSKRVLVKDGEGEPVLFDKYVDDKWSDFKDSLFPKSEADRRKEATPKYVSPGAGPRGVEALRDKSEEELVLETRKKVSF